MCFGLLPAQPPIVKKYKYENKQERHSAQLWVEEQSNGHLKIDFCHMVDNYFCIGFG
jgi:hypothetical protein